MKNISDAVELMKNMSREERSKLARILAEQELPPIDVHKLFENAADDRSIEEILMELAKEVPEEEWEKALSDLSENLDYYLYGSEKK